MMVSKINTARGGEVNTVYPAFSAVDTGIKLNLQDDYLVVLKESFS